MAETGAILRRPEIHEGVAFAQAGCEAARQVAEVVDVAPARLIQLLDQVPLGELLWQIPEHHRGDAAFSAIGSTAAGARKAGRGADMVAVGLRKPTGHLRNSIASASGCITSACVRRYCRIQHHLGIVIRGVVHLLSCKGLWRRRLRHLAASDWDQDRRVHDVRREVGVAVAAAEQAGRGQPHEHRLVQEALARQQVGVGRAEEVYEGVSEGLVPLLKKDLRHVLKLCATGKVSVAVCARARERQPMARSP
mmetsp:Transcript_104118/g.222443  ORF Transcript_104118/g.222443 Transcript_104118/m.222443 type:complete len:251 (+) Transcript_104118:295-1047(+)